MCFYKHCDPHLIGQGLYLKSYIKFLLKQLVASDSVITYVYYIRYSALQGFQALIKRIISHVRLFMIISLVKIIAFQTITNLSFWTFYVGGKPVVYIINKKIHGCLEIRDLFRVLNMISRLLRSLVRYHVQHSK